MEKKESDRMLMNADRSDSAAYNFVLGAKSVPHRFHSIAASIITRLLLQSYPFISHSSHARLISFKARLHEHCCTTIDL